MRDLKLRVPETFPSKRRSRGEEQEAQEETQRHLLKTPSKFMHEPAPYNEAREI